MAKFFDARILNVEYPLAPERPLPGAVADAFKAYVWLYDHQKVPAKRIAFMVNGSVCTLLNA